MKKLGAIFLICITSTLASANFTGTWNGIGVYSSDQGQKRCSQIYFNILQEGSKISLKGGQMNCEDKTINIKTFDGTILPDGTLLVYAIRVGKVTSESLIVDTTLGTGGRKYVRLVKNKGKLQLLFQRTEGKAWEKVTGELKFQKLF